MKNKGITLVALVVTIIILLILASVSINVLLGENGIITKAKLAKEKHEKETATEIIKMKIIECQMDSYEEKGELPTLAYLAAFLENDKKEIRDIEYVMSESKALAVLDESPYEDWDKIYTKLEKYPYEFEIDSSFKVAINGEPIENAIPAGYMKTPTETKEITENGNDIDVLNYAKVNVNVPLPEGFVKPIGTKTITTNGKYDVTEYKQVEVNVPASQVNGTLTLTSEQKSTNIDVASYKYVNTMALYSKQEYDLAASTARGCDRKTITFPTNANTCKFDFGYVPSFMFIIHPGGYIFSYDSVKTVFFAPKGDKLTTTSVFSVSGTEIVITPKGPTNWQGIVMDIYAIK